MNTRARRPARRPARPSTPRPTTPAAAQPAPTPTVGADERYGLHYLDPREIVWPDVRITSEYRDGDREALDLSIEGVGQQTPVTVFLGPNGEYVGADGMNRCLRAIDRGETSILCHILPGDESAVLKSNIATALLRGRTNPRTVAETFARAVSDGTEPYELAQASGRAVEYVEKMLLIAEASPAVLQALGDDYIGQGHAEIIAGLPDHAEQDRVLQYQLANRLTVKELEQYVYANEEADEEEDDRPARGKRGPKVDSGPRQCTSCHEEHDSNEVTRLELCTDCLGKYESGDDRATAELARDLFIDLQHAEQALAESSVTAPLAERIGRLVERLTKEGRAAPSYPQESEGHSPDAVEYSPEFGEDDEEGEGE